MPIVFYQRHTIFTAILYNGSKFRKNPQILYEDKKASEDRITANSITAIKAVAVRIMGNKSIHGKHILKGQQIWQKLFYNQSADIIF